MCVSTYMKNRKYFFNERIFENIDSNEKAYWLGFLMADGSISTKHGLRLGLTDFDMIEKFKSFMHADNTPITDEYTPNSHKKTISLYSKKMYIDLQKYGLIENKTYRTEIRNIPDDFINSFILGYFDGDGSIYVADLYKKTNKCYVNISSSSYHILQQIESILKKIKILSININYIRRLSLDNR